MTDYNKTIIYKLINYDFPELVYVGSTTNFTKRKYHHKHAVYNIDGPKYNRKLYVSIRENGGWESWEMIKICDYPCKDRRESEKEEDKYMMKLKANLNMHRASRTKQQHYEDNKNKIKERVKQYNEDNKDKIKERMKQHYEINKEKINEQRTIKCNCECGSSFRQSDKARHERSIKHKKYLERLEYNSESTLNL